MRRQNENEMISGTNDKFLEGISVEDVTGVVQ